MVQRNLRLMMCPVSTNLILCIVNSRSFASGFMISVFCFLNFCFWFCAFRSQVSALFFVVSLSVVRCLRFALCTHWLAFAPKRCKMMRNENHC